MFCNKYNHSVDDKGRLISRPMVAARCVHTTQSHNFYITTNLWNPKRAERNRVCACGRRSNFGELKAKLENVSDSQESVRTIQV